MKKLSFILIIVIYSFLLCSCSIEDENLIPDTYNTERIIVEYKAIDFEILDLINTYRTSIDLEPLALLNEATRESIAHNQYMITEGSVSHDFFYIRFQNLVEAVEAKQVLENVGYGFSGAESVVFAWLK